MFSVGVIFLLYCCHVDESPLLVLGALGLIGEYRAISLVASLLLLFLGLWVVYLC